jgi:hypothetical protein
MSRLTPLWVLLRCEMTSLSRCRAFRIGSLVYVAALMVFVFGWGETNTAGRAGEVEAVLLVLLMPWMAVRCASAERGDELVILGAILGVRPSQILIARAVAIASALVVVAMSGAPVLILAHRIGANSTPDLLRSLAGQLGLAVAATAAAVAAQQLWAGRVRVWLAAGAVTAVVAALSEVMR